MKRGKMVNDCPEGITLTEEEARIVYTHLSGTVTPTVGYAPFHSLLKKCEKYGIHCHYCTNRAEKRNHRGYMVCDACDTEHLVALMKESLIRD